MMKKLLFATALLAPGLAYGGNPSADLSVQVVPAGTAGTCGTITGQAATDAAAAGFGTCALYNDFTTAIPNTVGTGLPSNWLNCSNTYVAGSVWNMPTYNPPCNAITQVTDSGGGGNLALDLHYNRAWMVQASQYDNFTEMVTSSWDGSDPPSAYGKVGFSNGYFEITARMTADTGSFAGEQQAFWSWICCTTNLTFVEQDFFEDWSTGGQHMDIAWDWWTGPPLTGQGFANGTSYPAHTQSDYHTFGTLITGNYASFAVCNYFDGTRIGCYNQSYKSGQDGTQRRTLWVQNGAQCNTGVYGDIRCVGSFNDSHMYIKSIKAVTCAAEPAGGSCIGNTYNGNFYQ